MPNFVRLPSGEIVNTAHIVSAEWQNRYEDPEHSHKTRMLIVHMQGEVSSGDTWARKYKGLDARALYAYLSAQAVAIGEDGKAVTPEAEPISQHAEPSLPLSLIHERKLMVSKEARTARDKAIGTNSPFDRDMWKEMYGRWLELDQLYDMVKPSDEGGSL